MCEVTKDNFETVFPQVVAAIKEADFIAIDCEFTGINLSKASFPSFFDSPQDRYDKLKNVASNFTICQIGLSAFTSAGKHKYTAKTYNFYLYPHGFGPVDVNFMIEPEATEFLCKHNFDFNKAIYKGIPFLNQAQERLIQTNHRKGILTTDCHIGFFQRQQNDQFVTGICSNISNWLTSSDDVLEFECPKNGITEYVLLSVLEKRFWGKFSYSAVPFSDKIRLKKFSKDEKCCVDYFEKEYQRIIKAQLGFSNVVQHLIENKKPIVGHNCIIDVMFFFQKFLKPLPNNYEIFKKEINDFFPIIYDTKFLASKAKQTFKKIRYFDKTGLGELYRNLSRHEVKFSKLYSPEISHDAETNKYVSEGCPHEAGYDSYMTGYVFIRMAHFFATKGINTTTVSRSLLPQEYFESLDEYKNCLVLPKFQQRFMKLDGKDPPRDNVIKYYIASRSHNSPLLPSDVANEFVVYGSVDVQVTGRSEAIVAVLYNKRNKNIEEAFKRHKKYRVVKYHPLWHWRGIKKIWFGSLIVLLGTLAAAVAFKF